MKIAHAESHILESGGLQEISQTFKIRTNAHAFKILSSGLYSDKIAAPLRELACNAHDSHVAAGKASSPIEVKLPNTIDPQFYIKDFGEGLSHEEVMNLYTTYFASTKQDSNDFTGAFGLGSKSPFAYTDSFTVESCYHGTKSIYSAHIGDDNSPKIMRITETECGPNTGITVGFPVRTTDFNVFKERAQTIFQFFTPLPTIIGSEAIIPAKYTIDRGEYAFTENNTFRSPNYVQMGNVVYPLNCNNLGIEYNNTILYPLVSASRLFLRFKLGELSVAASREQLEYDKSTQKAIRERMEFLVRDMVNHIEGLWTTHGQGTFIERCEFRDIAAASKSDLHIDQKLLTALGNKNAAKMAEALNYHSATLPKKDYGNVKVTYMKKHNNRAKVQRWDNDLNNQVRIPYDKDTVIVAGMESQAFARARKALIDGDLINILLVYVPTSSPGTKGELDSVTAYLKGELGDIDTRNLKDFPKPIVQRTVVIAGGKRSKIPIFDVNVPGKGLVQVDQVPDENRIYTVCAPRNSGFLVNGQLFGRYEQYRASKIIDKLTIDLSLPSPIKIPKAREKQLAKHTGWKEYGQHVQDIFESKEFKDKLQKECKNYIVPADKGALYELRQFRDQCTDGWKVLKTLIPEHCEAVEKEVKALATRNKRVPEMIQNYREACDHFKLRGDFKSYDLSQRMQIKENPALTCEVLQMLYEHAPKVLPVYLKEVL